MSDWYDTFYFTVSDCYDTDRVWLCYNSEVFLLLWYWQFLTVWDCYDADRVWLCQTVMILTGFDCQTVMTLTGCVADHFLFVVHKLYCVTYIQALAVLSCRLTQDERQAWCKKGLEVSTLSICSESLGPPPAGTGHCHWNHCPLWEWGEGWSKWSMELLAAQLDGHVKQVWGLLNWMLYFIISRNSHSFLITYQILLLSPEIHIVFS